MTGEFGRHRHRVGPVAFGSEPRLARIKLGEAFGHDGQIRAGHRLVEPQQNIAGLHMIAILNKQLTDDAAGRMLYFFHVRIDDDRSLRDQGARDLRRGRPSAQSEHQRADQDGSGDDVAADRYAGA